MRDWQPIETAPKDGTQVVITDGFTVVVGYWSAQQGWSVQWDNSAFCETGEMDATLWFPIPAQPEATP